MSAHTGYAGEVVVIGAARFSVTTKEINRNVKKRTGTFRQCAQADFILRLAHMSEVTFSHDAAQSKMLLLRCL